MAIYQVNIVSMNVTDTDDGFNNDTLEAKFTFNVNGEVQVFKKDIGTGVHDIGLPFIVDIPNSQTQIRVEASGKESDPIWDDTLPGFVDTWGENRNWGEGSHTVSRGNGSISYALTYEIILTSETVSFVPLSTLIAFGVAAATLRDSKVPRDSLALTWSINRVARSGWKLAQMRDDEAVFKGSGPFLELIEERFGEEGGEPARDGKYQARAAVSGD